MKRCSQSPHRNISIRRLCSSSPNPPTDEENFRAIVLDFINTSNARYAISEERHAISEERHSELEIWKSSIDEYKPVWDKVEVTYELAVRDNLRRQKGEEFVRNLSSDFARRQARRSRQV